MHSINLRTKKAPNGALGILQYLQDNDYEVTLSAIAKPDKVLDKLDDALKYGLEHEQYVTSLIDRKSVV